MLHVSTIFLFLIIRGYVGIVYMTVIDLISFDLEFPHFSHTISQIKYISFKIVYHLFLPGVGERCKPSLHILCRQDPPHSPLKYYQLPPEMMRRIQNLSKEHMVLSRCSFNRICFEPWYDRIDTS